MPTPDTFLMAKADALRRMPTRDSQRLQAAEVDFGQRVGRGVRDTLASYAHPIQYLKDTLTGLRQFVKEPVNSTKEMVRALKQPEVAGSMIVPDPLKLVKALKGTKALPPTVSNIIVPESLALPDEIDALKATKEFGLPESETGWFKGPKDIYFKEDVPLTVHPDEWDKVRLTPEGRKFGYEGQKDAIINWDHPTLPRRGKMPEMLASNIPDEELGVYLPHLNQGFLNRFKLDKSGNRKMMEVLSHEMGHGIQEVGTLPQALRGTSPGKGVSTYRYLTNPGEMMAQIAALRDLAPAGYRRMIPFMDDYNAYLAKLTFEKDAGKKPRMANPSFLYDRIEEHTGGKVHLDDFLD